MIEVIQPGAATTVQDLGRPGFAHLGVSRAGAADRDSLRLANRLVGNPEHYAGLESTLTGPRLRLRSACTFAVAGAPAVIALDGVEVAMHQAVAAAAGSELQLGIAIRGLRTYVAFAGGIACAPVLGSRSFDTRGRLGPPPLVAGQRLPIGSVAGPAPPLDAVPVADPAANVTLSVSAGPRADWFTADARRELARASYAVSKDSDRSGVRLEGPPLSRARTGELRSEGMTAGAVQVPPTGQPIILLADFPTTGGYPVVAVVAEADLGAVAQLRQGSTVRFRPDRSWDRGCGASHGGRAHG